MTSWRAGLLGMCLTASAADAEPDAGEPLAELDAGFLDGEENFGLDAGVDAGPAVVALAPVAEDAVTPSVTETVVVGTSEVRTAGSVHILKASRLDRLKIDDPHALLKSVPGVYVRGEDGFGLRPNIGLRGANSDRSKKVTLLEDGVLLGLAPYSAPAAYFLPLVNRMRAVRVLKGPSAIMYGPNTVGGAIDFVTRDVPSNLTAGLDVAFGQYLTGRGHAYFGAGNETTGFLVEALHLRSSGFKVLDGGGDTGFARTDVMMKGRHRFELFGVRQALAVKLGYSSEESNETYLGLTDADFRSAPLRRYVSSSLDRLEWQRTQAELSHRLEVGPFTLTTVAYRHDVRRTWRKLNRFRGADLESVLANPEGPRNAIFYGVLTGTFDSSTNLDVLLIGPNQRTFISQGIQTTGQVSFATGPLRHGVEAQLRYHFDSVERRHTEDAFQVRGGTLVPEGTPTVLLVNNRDSTHAFSAYVTDAVRIGPVTLTPGLRVEVIRSESRDFLQQQATPGGIDIVLPGLGAHWAITESLGVLAGAYRGFSPPPPGRQRALPELALNAEAGARWSRPGKERLEAIGFFNDYANLTNICTFSTGCVNQNIDQQFDAGRAYIWGVEVFGEKTFRPASGLSFPLSVAYTYTGTRLLTSFSSADPILGNVNEGDELPYVPAHQLSATAGVDVWRVGLYATASYTGAMRERAGQGAAEPGELTDAVLIVDARLVLQLTDWARISLDARNLFDQRAIAGRLPYGARPNAPRMIMGGVTLNW